MSSSIEITKGGDEAPGLIAYVIHTHFADVLLPPTTTRIPAMPGMEDQALCVTKYKNDPTKSLTIWFKALEWMTMGGRSVESGSGPNYYSNTHELKLCIRRAMWQAEHPDKDEYETPDYEEFEDK